MSLEKRLLEETSRAKISNRIIATKTWTSNKDKKDFNQELNKTEVFLLQRESIAKGAIKTKTFIKTYLTA